ncbi:MAG: outer membrane protein assembly factor BamB family protein, partial [Deltaproteobacteria bacterium]
DPKTGASAFELELGRGQKPKGFATATPVVSGDVVYVSSIVDGTTHAIGLDGKPRWKAKVPGAGAGLVVGDDAVYVAAGPRLVALGRRDGTPRGEVKVGGHLGPGTPLLLGETLVATNLYGWVVAVPTSAFVKP